MFSSRIVDIIGCTINSVCLSTVSHWYFPHWLGTTAR